MRNRVGSYMRVLLGAAIIVSGILATISVAPERALAAVTNLYASPSGSGSTCSEGSPCSLSGVQTKVRTLNGNMSDDIIVHLRGGTYSLTSPMTLNASDSGTNGYMVRYQAYSGETPIFEGGQAVTGWTLHDAGKNIYKANVGSRQFRQIYVADQRGIRARTPNQTDAVNAGPYHTAVSVSGSTFVVNSGQITNWANLTQVEVVWRGYWMQKIGRIQSYSVNGSQATIAFQSPEAAGFVDRSYTDMPTTYFHFENAYEFLDAEGEWYLNTSQQTLYYKPRTGENMSTVSVVTPVTESLVNVAGTSGAQVHHVKFQGITFQHTNWTKPSSTGLVDGQAMVQLQSDGNSFIPGAVNVSNAHHITFEGNTFRRTGAHGILFTALSENNTVTGNTFTDLSGGGVYSSTEDSSYDTFSNNLVDKYGQYYTGSVGIYAMRPDHMLVDHNTVRYGRYTGISLGWSWNDSETGTNDDHITNNLIHNVMQLHDDGAGIYSLGKQTNGLRSGNYIHSIVRSPYTGGYPIAGIYLDNGSSYITIENNVLDNTVHAFYGNNSPNHHNTYQDNYYNIERGLIAGNNGGTQGRSFVPANFRYSSSLTPFVSNQSLGTLRNNFTGWVGMKFTIGSSPVTVKQLGRWVVSGNSGTHTVKITNATTGVDVASVSVATAGAPAGYKYVALPSDVTLSANTSYYLISSETSGGDQWYDANTTVTTTGAGTNDHEFYSVGQPEVSNVVQNNTFVSGAWPSGATTIMNGAGVSGSSLPPSTPIHIEAESYNNMSGISNYGTVIGALDGGDWVRYNAVDLGSGYTTFTARYSRGNGGNGSAEIRLDSTTGTLVGTLTLASTGSWSTYTTASTSLTGASGTHDIYLVFPSGTGNANLDWLEFSGGSSLPPSTPIHIEAESYNNMSGISNYGTVIGALDGGDWVRYNAVDLGSGYTTFTARYSRGNGGNGSAEIRLDSTTGTLVGTLTLASTGSWSTYTTANTSLTGASGTHDIYLVFPSGTGNANLDWLEFDGGTGSTPSTVVYEAENGTYGNGGQEQNASNASNGKVVGNLNAEGSYTQVGNVDGGTGGNATVVIRYANGYGTNRSLSLYINGVDVQQVVFAPTGGWNTFADTASITISLNAGTSNTIKLQRDAADAYSADIDKFTVTK